jgi:hypothetical protein
MTYQHLMNEHVIEFLVDRKRCLRQHADKIREAHPHLADACFEVSLHVSDRALNEIRAQRGDQI